MDKTDKDEANTNINDVVLFSFPSENKTNDVKHGD